MLVRYALIFMAIVSISGGIYIKGVSDGKDSAKQKYEKIALKQRNKLEKALQQAEDKNLVFSKEMARLSGALKANHETRKKVIIKKYRDHNPSILNSSELHLVNESRADPRKKVETK